MAAKIRSWICGIPRFWDTETGVIPLIPLILGRRIRFWSWNYVSVFDCWRGGGHLNANSKMTAKNNEYTPGTHWSPIRMMPARLPNALWYSIMFAWLSHIKPVQMMILYRSEERSLHNSRWRSAAILDLWICQMWHRDLSTTSNITNCRAENMFLALIKCFEFILMSK